MASPVTPQHSFERRTTGPGTPLRHWTSTDSTNRRARAWLAEGAPDGAVAMADHQTAGRGRFDRLWQSEPGLNLLFTVILKSVPMSDRPGLIPLATALAVGRGIEQATGLRARIKWPNDVLIQDKKTAGILVERISEGDGGSAILIGIGINVNQVRFPEGIESSAVSLSLAVGRPVDRPAVYHAVMDALARELGSLAAKPEEVLERYRARLAGIGSDVTIRKSDTGIPVRGILSGVAEDGGLVVDEGGTRNVYYAGDVTIGN